MYVDMILRWVTISRAIENQTYWNIEKKREKNSRGSYIRWMLLSRNIGSTSYLRNQAIETTPVHLHNMENFMEVCKRKEAFYRLLNIQEHIFLPRE
jgi:hypothetical protein